VRCVRREGLSIAEVLSLTASEAVERFAACRAARVALEPLVEVGLGYLRLGQPLSTLSSGEAQRLRLAEALAERPGSGARLYLFDEPTTGLHMEDTARLIEALRRLAERGHAVLVVEHNLEVLRAADRIVDLGPEGGPEGGRIVADGTPEEVARGEGHTARFLRAADAPVVLPDAATRVRESAVPDAIVVHGAREHNLRDLSVRIPRDRLVVVSGPSGSGKSTLAFDIVLAEGQRRYIDTLSAYARQFVGQMSRPDVVLVEGIPPTVAIEQRTSRGSRRSTVATVTEVAHFLRLLFSRAGTPHCPACDRELVPLDPATIYDRVLEEHVGRTVQFFAPVVLGRKGFHREVFEAMARRGHGRARVDGRVVPADPPPRLDRYREHDIEEEIGAVRVGRAARNELRRLIDEALALGGGTVAVLGEEGPPRSLSVRRTCPRDGATVPDLDPRLFSHNSHRGWCPGCQGLGTRPEVDPDRLPTEGELSVRDGAVRALTVDAGLHRLFVREAREVLGIDTGVPWSELPTSERRRLLRGHRGTRGVPFRGAAERLEQFLSGCPDIAIDWFGDYATRRACSACAGERLRPEARAVRVGGRRLPELLALPAARLLPALEGMELSTRDAAILKPVVREVRERVAFLERLGLGYLALDRDAPSLSGGEAQRIRLAAQLGSNLRGVCYVLDEPTIGLHPRDNDRLLDALVELRDRGNSMIVVEHDPATIRRADLVIDLGPGGGRRGGKLVASGTPEVIALDPESPTGRVLARPPPPLASSPRGADEVLVVEGAARHNLRDLTLRLPLGRLVALTGVSGSGKSTLLREVLGAAVAAEVSGRPPAERCWRRVRGADRLARVLEVDASPVGRTPRSVPATYLGIWDEIRRALASTPEARARGYAPGRFSFNREGGRCPACEGKGRITVELSFLPEVETPCERCSGRRFEEATLEVRWLGRSAADLLALTFAEAASVFGAFPRVASFVALMNEVGLDYLALGQPTTTLSGGEAQRLKLVTELGRRDRDEGRTLYLLDEPTTGLHGEDVDRLLAAVRRLVERGDTVVAIEHHLEWIARSDHVVDLGPEGGEAGGRIVAEGSPREVAARWRTSHTGRALRDATRARRHAAVAR
jgi:excinuclease ABC subunit A